jgi:hypothetical protein
MENPDDIKNPGSNPTDQGEDSEERREAAQKVWRDRSGVPTGTPEEGGRSATPGRETDDSVEPAQKRAPEVDDVDDIEEKR